MVIKQEQLFKKSGKNEPPIPEEVLRRLVLALHKTFFKPYEIKRNCFDEKVVIKLDISKLKLKLCFAVPKNSLTTGNYKKVFKVIPIL